MTERRRRQRITAAAGGRALAVVMLAVAALVARDEAKAAPPYGAPDFRPSAEQPVGWRGNGSGSFPGATPPVRFSDGTTWKRVEEPDPRNKKRMAEVIRFTRDVAKSVNARWRVLLPNWSNGSPIVVGKKVFVTAEPLDIAPLLLCLDADSGRELWRREVDHLSLLPQAEGDKVRAEWSAFTRRARDVARLLAERLALERRTPPTKHRGPALGTTDDVLPELDDLLAKPREKTPLEKEIDDWEERAKKLNAHTMDFKRLKWGGVRAAGILTDEQQQRLRLLRSKYGCYFPTWEVGLAKNRFQVGAHVGYTHPTPASDGESVYVFTAYNCAAAFDLEGNLRWLRWLGVRKAVRKAGWVDFTQSPVLAGDLLLVASKAALTALDTATGETVWTAEPAEEHIARAAGYDCLLFTGTLLQVAGETYFFWYDGRVYRVRDGTAVTPRLMDSEPMYVSCCPVAHGDTLVYFSPPNGKDKAKCRATAVRLVPDGASQLRAETLWSENLGGRPRTGVLANDRLYLPFSKNCTAYPGPVNPARSKNGYDVIRDPESGESVGKGFFAADHLSGIVHAGEYLFTLESLRSGQARFRIHNLDGKLVETTHLSSAPLTDDRRHLVKGYRAEDTWHDNHYHGSFHAVPYFQGSRIYVRSRDELFCFETGVDGPEADPENP